MESRARVIASADETRRRIERDLHDGAQQRLVTLALQLRAGDPPVLARIEDGRLLLDPRTLTDDEVEPVRQAVRRGMASPYS